MSFLDDKETSHIYKAFISGNYLEETFGTFDEAFEALYYSIVNTNILLSIDYIESKYWLELVDVETNERVCSRGFYDCLELARKLEVLDQNGRLTYKERTGMVRTTNKYFEKAIANETLSS